MRRWWDVTDRNTMVTKVTRNSTQDVTRTGVDIKTFSSIMKNLKKNKVLYNVKVLDSGDVAITWLTGEAVLLASKIKMEDSHFIGDKRLC